VICIAVKLNILPTLRDEQNFRMSDKRLRRETSTAEGEVVIGEQRKVLTEKLQYYYHLINVTNLIE
jgi:hypothetical protein